MTAAERWWPSMETVDGPVFLRVWTPADLPAIEAASQDPYIPVITTVPATYTSAAGHAWLSRQRAHLANRGRLSTAGRRDRVGRAEAVRA